MDDAEFKRIMEGAGCMELEPIDSPHRRATDYLARFIGACTGNDLEAQKDVYNEIIDGTMACPDVALNTVELFSESTINKARIVAAVVVKYRLMQLPDMTSWGEYGDSLTMLVADYDPNVAIKAAEARQEWRKAALARATDPQEREQILAAGRSQTPSFLPDWV